MSKARLKYCEECWFSRMILRRRCVSLIAQLLFRLTAVVVLTSIEPGKQNLLKQDLKIRNGLGAQVIEILESSVIDEDGCAPSGDVAPTPSIKTFDGLVQQSFPIPSSQQNCPRDGSLHWDCSTFLSSLTIYISVKRGLFGTHCLCRNSNKSPHMPDPNMSLERTSFDPSSIRRICSWNRTHPGGNIDSFHHC
jgi:hypothetical protein